MGKRWTEKRLEELILKLNPNIELIKGQVIKTENRLLFRCKLDGFTWPAYISNIKRFHSCARCEGKEPWSKEKLDYMLKSHPRSYVYIRGEIQGAKSGIIWKCTTCGFERKMTLDHMFNKEKPPVCPGCSTEGRHSVESIKHHLKHFNKPLELISTNYDPNNPILKWKCTIDGYVFDKPLQQIIAMTETLCRRCKDTEPIPFEEIRKLLEEKGSKIMPLANEYESDRQRKFNWKCMLCGHEWSDYVDNVLQRDNCPNCASNRKRTHAEIKELIEASGKILMLTEEKDYINSTEHDCSFKCLVEGCGYEWDTPARSIIAGAGCHECGGSRKKTYEEVCKTLESKWNIKVLTPKEEYVNTHGDLKVKCLLDDNEWTLPYHAILTYKGCQTCVPLVGGATKYTIKNAELNKEEWLTEPFIVYIIRVFNKEEAFQKIGVTSRTVNERFRGSDMCWNYNYEILREIKTNMYDGVWLEHNLHIKYTNISYSPNHDFGGKTECFKNLPEEILKGDKVIEEQVLYRGKRTKNE